MKQVPVFGRKIDRSAEPLLPFLTGGIRPVLRRLDKTVFDRVPVDVIDMGVEVAGVANGAFPKPASSNAALAFAAAGAGIALTRKQF